MIEPRYKSDRVELYCADCLNVLPQLEAGSVDAILTDLPYGTTQCAWDEIIPFEPMWREVKRILKPRGVFVTTASQPFTSKLVMSNLDWFKWEDIWDKHGPVGFLNAKKRPLRQHENILVFCSNTPNYYPIMDRKTIQIFGKTKPAKDFSAAYGDHGTNKKQNQGYPRSIIRIPRPNNLTNNDQSGLHSTQKPEALYRYLIMTFTNENDLVVDFTAGSGTTGVAAMQTGRRFIGIEIDEKYYQIAEKRIRAAESQLLLGI